MKKFWRNFKDWLIKFAIIGLAKVDAVKAKAKVLQILKDIEAKKAGKDGNRK